MENLIWSVLALALETPALQDQLTIPLAMAIKEKLPAAADRAIGDLLVKLGTQLGGGPQAPVVGV